MGFRDIQLSEKVEQGSSDGPGWKNRIIEMEDSGADEVVASPSPRWRFNIRYGIQTLANVAEVRNHYMAVNGAANNFPFKNWSDYNSSAAAAYAPGTITNQDQLIGTGDGTTVLFQLVKRYTQGAWSHVRTIRKPVTSSLLVALDATAQTQGTHYSVDRATGLVLFNTAPANGLLVKAGFEYHVPVRYDKGADEWLEFRHEGYDTVSVPDVFLVEQRDPGGDPEDLPMGGGTNVGNIAIDFFITQANGFAQSHTPTVTGRSGFLPDATNLSDGRPYFHLRNSGSFAYTVKSSTGVTVGTIGTSTTALVALFKEASGAKAWVLK